MAGLMEKCARDRAAGFATFVDLAAFRPMLWPMLAFCLMVWALWWDTLYANRICRCDITFEKNAMLIRKVVPGRCEEAVHKHAKALHGRNRYSRWQDRPDRRKA
ncbi:hypothetical protein FJU08_04445 [Martelella alba]|uniref:Uncharacterized protein n=1 Tax=Martelella alba TaxID=2590451 RepID=A0A506UCU0_9HYPH|nr:hypothetical protein [Martelella alba]TPW32263.1 hypothetical protein FJU08_04445 [Martelella alba]